MVVSNQVEDTDCSKQFSNQLLGITSSNPNNNGEFSKWCINNNNSLNLTDSSLFKLNNIPQEVKPLFLMHNDFLYKTNKIKPRGDIKLPIVSVE